MHVSLSLGPTLKRSRILVPFMFKKGPRKDKGINALKLGNTFLTPRTVCSVYLKNELTGYQAHATQGQLVAEIPR